MTRMDAPASFGPLFSTVASPSPPVRGSRRRREAAPRPVVRLAGQHWMTRALDLVLSWSERVRQRRELVRFDDHLLRDIGITRAEALAEAAKPFWRA